MNMKYKYLIKIQDGITENLHKCFKLDIIY